MTDVTESDKDREARQDAVLAESEALKLRLLAHTDRLTTFLATLAERHGQTGNGSNGRVD